MKQLYLTVVTLLCFTLFANATARYWIGPANGQWSSTANWSESINGPGGASVPGAQDSAIFKSLAGARVRNLVHVNQSLVLQTLYVEGNIDVVLHASTPVVLT